MLDNVTGSFMMLLYRGPIENGTKAWGGRPLEFSGVNLSGSKAYRE